MVKIGVIIPVVNVRMAEDLLFNLSMNIHPAHHTVIINNSGEALNIPFDCDRYTEILPILPPLGVNESWTLGIEKLRAYHPCDLVSILNDDLIVGNDFLGRIAYAYRQMPSTYGCLCPQTVKSKAYVGRGASRSNATLLMNRREGWAMTFVADVLFSIPPIPQDLKTFCGDDWFWHHCQRQRRPWVKLLDNWIFHYGSVAVNRLGLQKTLKTEKGIFAQCL